VNPIPQPKNGDELRAVRAQPELLAPAIDVICARHGLPRAEVVPAASGSFPVFFAGETLVIKLVPDRWRPKYEIEKAAMLHLSACRLRVPVPDVVAAGDLDGWGYVVMSRLEGRPLVEVFRDLAADDQRRIARDIGALMADIHRAPVDAPGPLSLEWPAFVAEQTASAVKRHADGAPAAWLEAIPSFLERAAPLLRGFRPALVTADIHGDHVLLRERQGRVEISGFFDFGDAVVGDPAYDFVTPATFIVRGRQDLMASLLDGYGVAAQDRTEELRARFFAYELLHRFATLARDVGMLEERRPVAMLADVERALFPFA
jgi:hygromycin-B 7''-O-kinase